MYTDRLSLLARRLSGLAARRSGFALTLLGEAGIGKSFTAKVLLQGGSCARFSTPATRPLPNVLSALPRPKRCPASLEGTLERLKRGETLEPKVALDALCSLLAALAPFVLYFEDLHEAAPDQLEALTRLAERVGHLRGVALLSSSRTTPPAPFESLPLERLSPIQSRELLEGEVHTALPPEALEWIYSKAAGNPLYTLEFFRSLSRAGFAWSDGQRWHWREPLDTMVPVSVEALIERTLLEAAPSHDTQAALEAMALLPDADQALLVVVSGLESAQFEQAVGQLRARGILKGPSFAHPLYREMTLKNLSPGRRQCLSSAALEALEGRDVEAAASFVPEAGLESAVALELLRKATASAKARGDASRAGQFLAQAVEWASGTERGELALEASTLLEGNQTAESLRLAELAVLEMPGHLGATLALAGKRVSASRRVQDAEPLLERLSAALRRGPEVLRARLGFHMACGDFVGALERWAELESAPPDAASAYYVAASLAQTGRFAEAVVQVEVALEQPELTPPLKIRLLNVLGMAHTFMSHREAAELAQREAIALAREHGLFLMLAASLQNYALNLERTERYPERRAAAEGAVDAYLRVGERPWAMNAQLVVVDSHLIGGEYLNAETKLLECWEGLRPPGPSAHLLAVECAFVKLYLAWDHASARALAQKFALHGLRDAEALGEGVKMTAHTYAVAALVEARWGDPARAEVLAQRAALIAGDASDQLEFVIEGAFAAALEARGEGGEAHSRYARATELALEKGFAPDAQIYALEGDRLSHNFESAKARLKWFELRALHHGANLVRRYFPELASSEPVTPVQPHPVRLEVLGPLLLEGQSIRGSKRQELLKVLLEARLSGKGGVSTLELLSTLYPDESEESALIALKGAVSKTRARSGSGIILTMPGGYALGAVSSDAEDFFKTGQTRLWRGVYRPLENGAVCETLSLALGRAAYAELERDPQEAARAARILCEMNPYSVENLKLLCEALKTGGNYKSLAREYQKGRIRLLEVGETLPQGWSDFFRTSLPA